jgi:YesN/AraC family two-component response regulator
VLNTLARKAVENGGVHPIYIDSVSSDFALKIEAAKNTDECDELFFTMIRKYSRLVQKHSQKDYSLLVQKVITCIDTDITADLSLKTQAKLLNVNPSYLSTLFKKETGVTLTDYVNKKRVERAKHLLKNGNTQIQTVAQSCGILDVNYFTKIFKKYEGVTPKEYRTK